MESISEDSIRECLERSGYILESRIVRALNEAGYFVEPNQAILDQKTGKSREIDFLAETADHPYPSHRTVVTTRFVGEIFNNNQPFVLITNRPSSPNEDTESQFKWHYTEGLDSFLGNTDIYEIKSPARDSLFSQYCVISKKNNGQLMASHPDDIYHSLQKMSEHIEIEIKRYVDATKSSPKKYFLMNFWHPILVLGGELHCVKTNNNGSVNIRPCNSGYLEFNWHFEGVPCTTVIEIIKFDSLISRMNEIVSADASIRLKILENRKVIFAGETP